MWAEEDETSKNELSGAIIAPLLLSDKNLRALPVSSGK